MPAAGWKPFGLGEQKPHRYLAIAGAAWENRDNLAYAGRILEHGVCDGCSLGAKGAARRDAIMSVGAGFSRSRA